MGGGDNDSQKAAEQAERERQAQIQQSVGAIQGVYASPEREAQYKDFLDATRQYYEQDLNKQKGVADRDLKFALARTGLTGGSRSKDAGTDLGEEYTQGLLEVGRRAQEAESGLRSADLQSQQNLLAMAQSGLDATTAAQQAAAALQTNLGAGQATRTAQGLGDVFGGVAKVKTASEEAAERRRAEKAYGNSLYSPWFAWGGQ